MQQRHSQQIGAKWKSRDVGVVYIYPRGSNPKGHLGTNTNSLFLRKIPVAPPLCNCTSPFPSEMEEEQKELELLPSGHSIASASHLASDSSMLRLLSTVSSEGTPSLDLQLSISVSPIRPPSECVLKQHEASCVEGLKWQAAEQIRLAAMEKAYAERVRELTRREMELAQSEFARARQMWERAREEVERAERMKERATRQIDSTCMEITCQSCRQRFRP